MFSSVQTENATAQIIILVKLRSPAFLGSLQTFTCAPLMDRPMYYTLWYVSQAQRDSSRGFSLLAVKPICLAARGASDASLGKNYVELARRDWTRRRSYRVVACRELAFGVSRNAVGRIFRP